MIFHGRTLLPVFVYMCPHPLGQRHESPLLLRRALQITKRKMPEILIMTLVKKSKTWIVLFGKMLSIIHFGSV